MKALGPGTVPPTLDAMSVPRAVSALAGVRRRPRMVATDLDGTVIGYAHTRTGRLSPRTIDALQAAHDAGVTVVFVTGRPLRWLSPLRDQLGTVGPVICSNGAVMVDPATDQVLLSHGMEHADVWKATARLRAADETAIFGAETLGGFVWEPAFGERAEGVTGAQTGGQAGAAHRLEHMLPGDATVVKLMARSGHRTPDELLAWTRELVGDLVSVTHSAPDLPLVEMAVRGVHKAATLEEYAGRLGIAAEQVVAFGDMPNDVEMLQWAGLGLAVASGHPELQAAADAVVGACDDDGVAEAIEHLLTLPE